MNRGEVLIVKVFPTSGSAFYVGVPESVDDVDLFLEDHLKDVDFWEAAEQGATKLWRAEHGILCNRLPG